MNNILYNLDSGTEFHVTNGNWDGCIAEKNGSKYELVFCPDKTEIITMHPDIGNLDIEFVVVRDSHSERFYEAFLSFYDYKKIERNNYQKSIDNGYNIELYIKGNNDIELKIWNEQLNMYTSTGDFNISQILEMEFKLCKVYKDSICNDCVSRAELKKWLDMNFSFGGALKKLEMFDRIDKELLPVTPIHKQGKWIENDKGVIICSCCNTWFSKDRKEYMLNCPYCLANMRGNSDDSN